MKYPAARPPTVSGWTAPYRTEGCAEFETGEFPTSIKSENRKGAKVSDSSLRPIAGQVLPPPTRGYASVRTRPLHVDSNRASYAVSFEDARPTGTFRSFFNCFTNAVRQGAFAIVFLAATTVLDGCKHVS